MARFRPVLAAGVSTLIATVASGYFFVSATATASGRFWYCGASSLDHVDPTCRVGTELLLIFYATGLLAIGLAVLTLWLHVRRLKGPNSSFKPSPLRGLGQNTPSSGGPA